MAIHLVVTNPFGDHARGDRITDAATVEAVRESHNAANVVAVTAPDEPVADPAAPAA